jgi:F-type H+-transporting ATPase subunit b
MSRLSLTLVVLSLTVAWSLAPARAQPEPRSAEHDSAPAGAATHDEHETADSAAHGEEHDRPNLFAGDLGNAIWTLVIFVCVLFVLGKFAWRPILGALQQREEFIQQSLAEAKRDREEAEARLREHAAQLDQAREEASAIVEEGRRDAEVARRRIHGEARAEADAIIARARREIGAARDTAVRELYDSVAEVATDVAARIIRQRLSPEEHRRLVDESIEELGKLSGDGRS